MSTYNYTGNLHPFAAVICHSADVERIRPILDEIAKSGLRLHVLDENNGNAEAILKKAFAVLCVLSGNFYNSTQMQEILLKSDALNKELIPMRMEDVPMPELISRMIYATNSINLQKYTPAEAAARILEAPVLKNPQRTRAQTRFVRGVGALALAAVLVISVVSAVSLFTKKAPAEEPGPDLSVFARYGLTEEDLEGIQSLVFTGDKLEEGTTIDNFYSYPSVWDYLIKTDDGWVRMENGSFVEMGGPEDFSFLQLLPNLQNLVLVNQTAERLPDLSGMEKLNHIELWNCAFTDLEGLRGCTPLGFIHITSDSITDLSPLSDCSHLNTVHTSDCTGITSMEGFCPPALKELRVEEKNLRDIAGLSQCTKLQTLTLRSQKLQDLSPLASCTQLTGVNIEVNDSPVTDFSPLGNCTAIQNLTIETDHILDVNFVRSLPALQEVVLNCDRITGVDSITTCSALQKFSLVIRGEAQRVSLDGLGETKQLNTIILSGVNPSFGFLRNLFSQNNPNQSLKLNVSGPVTDWAGLEAVPRFSFLTVNAWNGDSTQMLDAIRDTPVAELQLIGCRNLRAEDIPAQMDKLKLESTDIASLENLPCTGLTELKLEKCWALSSLSGLEGLEQLKRLEVQNNLRLSDWSAVYGKPLRYIGLTGQYALPDFGKLSLTEKAKIYLCEIPEMTDLSCLDALPDSIAVNGNISVSAIGGELANLNALLRFRGNGLTVSPQLEEQAQYLMNEGCFRHYEIEYPDENWNMEDVQLEIMSLDELDTLPKALLKYVTELNIADDTVYSMDYNPEIWVEEGGHQLSLRKWDTDEIIPVRGTGSQVDFGKLSQLTGLRELRLCGQKMDSLNGIQNLENLKVLTIIGCDIPDYSALFAVDSIEQLRLGGSNITSIQGIQNLSNLMLLGLQSANVTDLTPLAQMNFCPRACEEGFSLCLPHTWMVEAYPCDLSALAAVPKYDELNLNGYADTEWVSYLAGKDIWAGQFVSMFDRHDGQEKLEQLVDTVGSIGLLNLSWSEEIIDLTCLTKLEGLQRVDISPDMERAIRSLGGTDYQFELRVEG